MARADESVKRGSKFNLGTFANLKANVLDLSVASIFMNFLALALPLSLLQIYDRIVPNSSTSTLVLLILGVVAALLLESVLRTARSYITGWVGARFDYLAGCAAMERLLTTSIQDYEVEGSGKHMENMSSLGTVKEFYAGQALVSVLDVFFVPVFWFLVGVLGGLLVLVPIGMLFVFIAAAVISGNRLKDKIAERMVADDRRFNFIIEVLNGIHTIKSMAMEAQMMRRYERLQESCAKSEYDVTLHSAAAMNMGSFFSSATMVLVVAFGSTYVIDGAMTVGGLAACTMLSGRSLQPLMRALSIWSRFQTISLAKERLEQIFALEPEVPPGMPPVASVTGKLEMRNITFRYSDKDPVIFENINLDVKPGECIGISGGNGSGKSTFLGMLLGAIKPTTGGVYLDDNDIRSYEPKSLKKHIAYLPQTGELFLGSIIENITMFNEDLSDEAVLIANALGLDEVVASMPLGYDTVVGEGTTDALPRGIKQRIAIARALIHGPQVVLFDEANSAIDGTGDKFLREALESLKGESTMILVTPRPSLLKLADRVFDLADGKLTLRTGPNPHLPPKMPPKPAVTQQPASTGKQADGPVPQGAPA